MRRAIASALTIAALAVAAVDVAHVARAETPPSRWEIARDPQVRERWELHVRVRQLLLLRNQLDTESMRGATLERARSMLEDGGAATSPDVRLRFDLGEVYYMLDRDERAIAVLVPALDLAPNHPAAGDALATLAYAYAKLDRSLEERATYGRYLAHVTDDRLRATAMLNLAEAEMRLGNLRDAIAGYKDTVELTESLPSGISQAHTLILSLWGLAVALDRDGQPREALVEARRAVMMDPGDSAIAHDTNVFFVPTYERHWYLAVGATVRAEDEKQPADAVVHWKTAEQHWKKYIDATEASDRWLPIARARRERVHARLVAVEARVPAAIPTKPAVVSGKPQAPPAKAPAKK